MPKRIRRTLLFLITVLAALPCSAEDNGTVVIESIKSDILGKTRRNALLRELRLYEGITFSNEEEMLQTLSTRFHDLNEKRFFKEFNTEITEIDSDRFELVIRAVDAFTFYPIPIIAYSTSLGIIAGGTISYRNAFGSMINQTVNCYWSPMQAHIMAKVGNIAAGPMTLEVQFEQLIGVNRFGTPSGEIVLKYNGMSSTASIRADIPLKLGSSWHYWLKPKAAFFYRYEFDYNTSSSLENNQFINHGFAPGIDHGLIFDSIIKEGNFRRGILFHFMNTNLRYTETDRNDVFLESDFIGLYPVTEWLEFSGRIGGFFALMGIRRNAGDRLRGTLNYMTYGTLGAYLTGQVNFRILHTSDDFEVQIRPFTDIGYVKSKEWDAGAESFEYCTGSSFAVFIKSFSLNMDFGWDFKRNRLEIIVGMKPFI